MLIKTLLFIDVVKVSKKLHDSTTSFIAGTAAMAFPPRNYFIVLTEEQNEQLFAWHGFVSCIFLTYNW